MFSSCTAGPYRADSPPGRSQARVLDIVAENFVAKDSTAEGPAPPAFEEVGAWLDRGLGEDLADAQQLRRGRAQGELVLLQPQEVAVDREVNVDADAAVDVQRGVRDAVAALGRPVLDRKSVV